jgi:DNA topoisomerase-1
MAPGPDVAELEGLRYVSDARPGFTRRRRGNHFEYFDPQGRRITDAAVLERVRGIGVPPAYRDVWICPHANGHIQAVGRDEKGRKQYCYHPRWRAVRDENKFAHVLQFAAKLPAVRECVARDLARPGLPREKVLAAVVRLLETTLIRVGNAEYAQKNQSYGLTTLRKKHVAVEGNTITFQFTGKSGKKWDLSVNDRRIAAVVRRCADIPGYDLFKYVGDDGVVREVGSADVNAYLKEISGEDFTAKDFRTWAGTVLAAVALAECETADCVTRAKKNVVAAVRRVAQQLGNTPAICRSCYVHPTVLSAYLDDGLADLRRKAQATETGLTDEEAMVLAFLRRREQPAPAPASRVA